MRHKRIHCCKSRFSLRDKGPRNNIPKSTFSPKKQYRCNLDRYSFVYVSSLQGELLFVSCYGTNYVQKQRLGGKKKQHDFVAGNVPNRMRSSKKKKSQRYTENCLFEFWRSPSRRRVTHLSSDGGVTLSDRFCTNNPFSFFFLQQFSYMFACFVGNCLYLYDTICMADNQHVITDCHRYQC